MFQKNRTKEKEGRVTLLNKEGIRVVSSHVKEASYVKTFWGENQEMAEERQHR